MDDVSEIGLVRPCAFWRSFRDSKTGCVLFRAALGVGFHIEGWGECAIHKVREDGELQFRVTDLETGNEICRKPTADAAKMFAISICTHNLSRKKAIVAKHWAVMGCGLPNEPAIEYVFGKSLIRNKR